MRRINRLRPVRLRHGRVFGKDGEVRLQGGKNVTWRAKPRAKGQESGGSRRERRAPRSGGGFRNGDPKASGTRRAFGTLIRSTESGRRRRSTLELQGMSTVSITWITPLRQSMSGMTTWASLMKTLPSSRLGNVKLLLSMRTRVASMMSPEKRSPGETW